jgi:acetyltransferase
MFDGTPVIIRRIRPEDSGMEQEFVRHLSEDSRYFCFIGSVRALPPKKLKHVTNIDYERQMAIVAAIMRKEKELELGVACCAATEPRGTGVSAKMRHNGTCMLITRRLNTRSNTQFRPAL